MAPDTIIRHGMALTTIRDLRLLGSACTTIHGRAGAWDFITVWDGSASVSGAAVAGGDLLYIVRLIALLIVVAFTEDGRYRSIITRISILIGRITFTTTDAMSRRVMYNAVNVIRPYQPEKVTVDNKRPLLLRATSRADPPIRVNLSAIIVSKQEIAVPVSHQTKLNVPATGITMFIQTGMEMFISAMIMAAGISARAVSGNQRSNPNK